MVILPEQEQILDFVCGDKEFWIVSGGQNLAYIKPAKAGASTNLNLVTASGHVYSFVLTEGTGDPDLKVFVTTDETITTPAQVNGAQKFYSAAQVDEARHAADDARHDAEDARKQLDAARDAANKTIDERVNEFRATYPTELQFPYRFKANQRPFNVSAIYTDGRFTYIRSDATELPALYEWIVDRLAEAGENAESGELPGRARRVHRPQGARQRVPRHRQSEVRVRALSGGASWTRTRTLPSVTAQRPIVARFAISACRPSACCPAMSRCGSCSASPSSSSLSSGSPAARRRPPGPSQRSDPRHRLSSVPITSGTTFRR